LKADAWTARERYIVFAAAWLLPVYLVYASFISPAQTRHTTLRAEIDQQRAEIRALEAKTQSILQALAEPEAQHHARRGELKQQIADMDEQLRALHKSLIPAHRVNALLQEMLARESTLQMVSLRTLPAAPLLPQDQKAMAAAAPSAAMPDSKAEPGVARVYKHGVEVTVRGSYEALHNYLTRLERSPTRMYWWRSQLTAGEHATLTLTLTIYTLSLDRAWLEV
jgi:MSHA biogenesis protein MshJ